MKKLLILLLIVSVSYAFNAKAWLALHIGYARHVDVSAGAANLGPTAPSFGIIGTNVVLCFDSNGEMSGSDFEVPSDWIGAEDMEFKIYWTNEAGSAIGDGETVKWVIQYRVIDWDAGEDIESGTIVTDTLTYTQSGAGADGDTHESEIVLDWDHADQPLVKGEVMGLLFNRDMTADTYGSDACVSKFEFAFTSINFPEH